MRRDTRYFLFDSKELAERFINLYGGIIACTDDGFYLRYFGDKVRNKTIVFVRFSKDEIDELVKALELKKKKMNNKLIYVYN